MGRGSSKAGGVTGGGAGGRNINVLKTTDVWSFRHRQNNEPFVDAINSAARTLEDDFPGLMRDVGTVNAVKLGKKDSNVLGFYSRTIGTLLDSSVNINTAYTDMEKTNIGYDQAVKDGFHPSRGNKSGIEAVSLHELGHALNDHVAAKMGLTDIMRMETAADRIVNSARRSAGRVAGRRGINQFRESISGYATTNNKEAIAEAVADYYCNGRNASTASKAIMAELFKYK